MDKTLDNINTIPNTTTGGDDWLNQYKKAAQQTQNTQYPQIQFTPQPSVCPHCGYCSHCGRGGHHVSPYYTPPYITYCNSDATGHF